MKKIGEIVFYAKEIPIISFIRLVLVNFLHTNSYKLVVFCGRMEVVVYFLSEIFKGKSLEN